MSAPTLHDLIVERDKLNAAIAAEQKRLRTAWNDGLHALEQQLEEARLTSTLWRTRKNERTVELRGGVMVSLGFIQDDLGPWLRVKCADGYRLSFQHEDGAAPHPVKFMALVKRLMEE